MGGKIAVRRDKFVAILVISLILMFLAFADIDYISLEFLSIFSLVNTIVITIVIFSLNKSLFSVSSMFFLFLAVFHFGQAWLYFFNIQVDTEVSYDIFELYHHKNIFNILMFSLRSYNLMVFFWIIFYKSGAEYDATPYSELSDKALLDRKIIAKFGFIMFIVLLLPVFIYDYLNIAIVAQYGHSGLYDNTGRLATWAAANSYFPFAIIMVLLGCDPNGKYWKWMYLFAVGRCVLLMILTGRRGSLVIPLLLYVFCKHHFIKKYEKKHFVWIAVAVFVLLFTISFIAYGRGNYSHLSFLQFAKEKNIFVQILSEFGATFTTTVLSYNYTRSFGLIDGKSYLGSLSVLLPFSNRLVPEIRQYLSVSAMLNPFSPSGGALGGSLIGEMYINFGHYGLLLTPIYAWTISVIENVINNAKKYSLFMVCCCIFISYGFWMYVRGNFVDVVFALKRTIYVLIAFLVYKAVFYKKDRGL